MDEPENLILRADDLDARISEETKRVIADLTNYSQKTRKVFTGIIAVLVLALVGVVFSLVGVSHNADNISDAKDAATFLAAVTRASCEADNITKAKERQLWDFILAFPQPPDQTPEQKAQRLAFEDLVHEVYQPLDCTLPPSVLPSTQTLPPEVQP